MKLGRIVGHVIPCEVYKGLEGVPMLWVQPLDKRGAPKGGLIVAADATRMAGPDEWVYYEGGREAAMALDPWFVPVDHAVIGIIDNLTLEPDAP
ncbi:MAG: ethanolamine utilization protein EutN [Spartobacteria bacterium]|nr:ethanolamine utilization protein EutN [Spartobacteria bacterium]